MSKKASTINAAIVAIIIGLGITLLTGLYSRITTGQYCSPDPAINQTIDCSLRVKNQGLPLAYNITPNYQLKHGMQPVEFIADLVVWSIVAGGVLLLIRKLAA